MKTIRIGSGAGYGGDRIEPALALMREGELDYIIFECLAERTIALAQLQKKRDPAKGYNDLFAYRMDKILDVWRQKRPRVITNMGAANPLAAAKLCVQMARQKGLSSLKVAAVTGDDVLDRLDQFLDLPVMETGRPLRTLAGAILSANAYIGVAGIVKALEQGADIIITGRVADPSLVLAPLVYEFGWAMDDYDKLGKGTIAGHLLECAGQVTGGYFCVPGRKDVDRLWDLGFPIAVVGADGSLAITKLPHSGGCVTERTCKEQILYEIQDPARYYTPDCTADFSGVRVHQREKNVVEITGVTGKKDNGYYKTSVGYQDCYIGEGQISYGGDAALERAKLAGEIVRKRLAICGCDYEELRIDYMGVNSLYRDQISTSCSDASPVEVRLRVAARTKDRQNAELVGNEVEALYTNGPAGGGGAVKSVREIVSVASVLIPKEVIVPTCTIEEV